MTMSEQDEHEIKYHVKELTKIAEANREDIKDISHMLKGDGTIGSGWQYEIAELKTRVNIMWKVGAFLITALGLQLIYTIWQLVTNAGKT